MNKNEFLEELKDTLYQGEKLSSYIATVLERQKEHELASNLPSLACLGLSTKLKVARKTRKQIMLMAY